MKEIQLDFLYFFALGPRAKNKMCYDVVICVNPVRQITEAQTFVLELIQYIAISPYAYDAWLARRERYFTAGAVNARIVSDENRIDRTNCLGKD